MDSKQVFRFQEGNAQMKSILGGKGAHLAEMTTSGLPVPPGFTITTAACLSYFKSGDGLSEKLWEETLRALESLESERGQRLGDPANPLLVSVRSGAVSSMPGMMDTILNLGLNDETVQGLARQTGSDRFAYDCYRRLLQMFGNVVLGIQGHHFEKIFHQLKQKEGVTQDQDVSIDGLRLLIPDFKKCIQAHAGRAFPDNVQEQLSLAIEAVFQSWNNPRAQIYRKINGIPDSQGTAVNIQSMVFGNLGTDCGTGVVFTRNPSTGASELFGEYLINAQGEDVVAGARTPQPVASLKNEMPKVYEELVGVANRLERHYKDMQDIEFTVEKGRLFILQTRNGKRNAQAAVTIAVNLVKEGILTREEALLRIEASHLDRLLHRGIDENAVTEVWTTGLPASPGAAVGQVAFDANVAMEWSQAGKKVILARPETTPEDIQGVLVSEGIVTCRGGMTSHAAVVARGMGKPCVCGCEEVKIDEERRQMSVGPRIVKEGDWVTIEGASGRILIGEIPLREPEISEELSQVLEWADSIRKLKVRANADNPRDAKAAKKFGAQGIGLCRTEHMFFSADRLPVVQRMILAEDGEERGAALEQLLPMQRADFEEMLGEMNGLPVTIRLLDPPLHEFLPKERELRKKLDELRHDSGTGNDKERKAVLAMIRKLHDLEEVNPMLGQRGCRLGIVYPEIYEMQVIAIFQAALSCMNRGIKTDLEIMVPLVGHVNELIALRTMIDNAAKRILGEANERTLSYRVGTMIEVPRAALTAGQIAPYADFFSFGTNDLTQMTYGYSRDDAEGKFLTHYQDRKILPNNPFQVLDPDGVGLLIEWAVTSGKSAKPGIKTGICGEHGGDKESIFFCHRSGLDYVSCSPFRLPLARIAAAQAAITYADPAATKKEFVPFSRQGA